MPKEKYAEARLQTQHKLETMERYWGAWATILAQTAGKYPFCPSRLWMVDTHSAEGRHLSEEDPEGEVPGTAVLAALAARQVQQSFAVKITVRASDVRRSVVKELDERLALLRNTGVDARAKTIDWVDNVPAITAEIATEADHPHGGRATAQAHQHRSLWFIDPYGVESIDHEVIMSLPKGSEVIINLDLSVLPRHATKAADGDPDVLAILERAYGGSGWRRILELTGSTDSRALALTFAESFPKSRWEYREPHLLRASRGQYRALVHLTTTPVARDTFERDVRTAMAAGTLAAGDILSRPQKDKAAHRLHELFRGLVVTPRQMKPAFSWSLTQLRAICTVADGLGLGRWDGTTMEWSDEPSKVAGSQRSFWDG
jgi:three-Cys-motif partner protein